MSASQAFELIRSEDIPELNSRATLYRHIRTGAELLSLENDDENKCFGITFRTPPADSTGVAHILEHSVLAGSRKFPLKEPFVQLMKGSLNTFLNALTFPDKTAYPVASQNLHDFYNLVDVYLDAVLYPLLDPYTFQQEGWHYEVDDPSGPLTFKGVVFNEMKGAYSSPEDLLGDAGRRASFPDNTYRFDSGGDPAQIPDLTYADFKRFHATYYSPSNARIFFYGDDDPQRRLEILEGYLKDFERVEVDSAVPLQPPFDAPRQVVLPYEVSESEEGQAVEHKSYLTVSWLLPEPLDAELSIGLGVLDHILAGTPASPLRKALIDSGLGEDLAGGGLEDGLRQLFYSIGLKGIRREDAPAVEKLILDTLAGLAEAGFDPDTVAASLNTVEFALRENNTGRFPRGLAVLFRALNLWLYGGDPFAALRLDAPLAAVQQRGRGGERYFEGLLQRHFLSNPHRVTTILEPDPALATRRLAAEQARLERTRAALSATDLQALADATAELKRRQETPDSAEALATIPLLRLEDLEPHIRQITTHTVRPESADLSAVLQHDLFTNNIIYFDLALNLHTLPPEWLPYVPLFSRALTQMGTRRQSFVQLIQRIGRSTGGIRVQPFISAAPQRREAEAWLLLRGKAMLPQTGELLAIVSEILTEVRLDDRERFRQLVLEEKAGLESRVVRAGHSYAGARLAARFHQAGWAGEQTGGLSYLFFIRDLAARLEQDWPAVLDCLEGIRARLVDRSRAVASVTLDTPHWATVQPAVLDFLDALPLARSSLAEWPHARPGTGSEGWSIPSQVNYVAMAGNLYEAGYQPTGAIMAVEQHLNTSWLWDRVRVQGGAYGGFCGFDLYSGVFSLLSYRDPNLLATVDIYNQTADHLRRLQLDPDERLKSIIGAVSDLDAYQLPDAKGHTALLRHLLGISDAYRQHLRDQLLATRAEDFTALGRALEIALHDAPVAVFGSAEALSAAAQQRPGWLQIGKVL